jgi:excisionase family DNA binding protein
VIPVATTPYLTVREVSGELGISTSGVYKLIGRGRLPAIRRSERGILVPRPAFDAYKRRLAGEHPPASPVFERSVDVETLATEFERETKHTPANWIDAWKADQLEDSAENMGRTIRALGILHARLDSGSADSPEAGLLPAATGKAR